MPEWGRINGEAIATGAADGIPTYIRASWVGGSWPSTGKDFFSLIDMSGDWMQWQESEPLEALRPETEWEGAGLEIAPSRKTVRYTCST